MKTAALGPLGGLVSLRFAAFDILPHSALLCSMLCLPYPKAFSPYPKAFSPYPKTLSPYPKAFSPCPKTFGWKASLSVCGGNKVIGSKKLIGGKKLVGS